MEATLTEVINLGNKVQKMYYVEPAAINALMLEYNLDSLSVDIFNTDTDEYLETIDLSLYDENVPDTSLDKIVLTEFLDARFIKIVKETDDYTDIL
jgi:hypothetical protein